MKLHLPVTLLSAVLACYSVAVLTASAETLTSNVTISTDTTWNETTTIGANGLTLTIETGKTLTQAQGAFNIGNNSITITGANYDTIEWIADGKVVATGATIDLDQVGKDVDNYVRAQLKGDNGISFTNAFGVDLN